MAQMFNASKCARCLARQMHLWIVAVALLGTCVVEAATQSKLRLRKERESDAIGNKLTNKFVDRVLTRWSFHHENLDNMTLSKIRDAVGRGTPCNGVPFHIPRFPYRRPCSSPCVFRSIVTNTQSSLPASPLPMAHSPSPVRRPLHISHADAEHLGEAVPKLKDLFVKNYLPIALTFAVVFGLAFPSLGQELAAINVRGCNVVTICAAYIFFVQGTMLKLSEIKRVFTAVPPLLYGLTTMLVIPPLMSIPVNSLTFLQEELRTGFALFLSMPATKSAGLAMVSAVNGNFAFALLLTIVTNILGIFTIPFYLHTLVPGIPGAASLQIDPLPILQELGLTILLPTCIGMAVKILGLDSITLNRSITLDRWQTPITLSTITATAIIPMIMISQTADAIFKLSSESVLAVGLVAAGLRVVYLMLNSLFTALFSLRFRKDLILMASQKTLTSAEMSMLSTLSTSGGTNSVIAVPLIIGHFTEAVVNSMMVAWMARWTRNPFKAMEEAKAEARTAARAADARAAADAAASSAAIALKAKMSNWERTHWESHVIATEALAAEAEAAVARGELAQVEETAAVDAEDAATKAKAAWAKMHRLGPF